LISLSNLRFKVPRWFVTWVRNLNLVNFLLSNKLAFSEPSV
jgi:hypothetical protein